MKLNTDAGIRNDNSFVLGVVGRDSDGVVWVAAARRKSGKRSVLVAELMAMEEALRVAAEFGARQLIVESDSLTTVQAVQSGHNFRNEAAVVIQNIRGLALGFSEVRWSHVRRSGNAVAHFLASPCFGDIDVCFKDAIPLCISPVIVADSSENE